MLVQSQKKYGCMCGCVVVILFLSLSVLRDCNHGSPQVQDKSFPSVCLDFFCKFVFVSVEWRVD